jgi:hypothetical protein
LPEGKLFKKYFLDEGQKLLNVKKGKEAIFDLWAWESCLKLFSSQSAHRNRNEDLELVKVLVW